MWKMYKRHEIKNFGPIYGKQKKRIKLFLNNMQGLTLLNDENFF